MSWVCTFVMVLMIGISEALKKVGEKQLTFKPPSLTEEDTESRFIPATFVCDSCKAVAYQLFRKYDNFNDQHRYYKYNIPESNLLDLTEEACKGNTFEYYGVKEVDGKKMLSGDGLKGKDLPGVLAGGGKWPGRLSSFCASLIGELDEEEIYSVYKKQPDDLLYFQNYLCFQNGIRGSCKANKPKNEL